jgi:hypothetical protein
MAEEFRGHVSRQACKRSTGTRCPFCHSDVGKSGWEGHGRLGCKEEGRERRTRTYTVEKVGKV